MKTTQEQVCTVLSHLASRRTRDADKRTLTIGLVDPAIEITSSSAKSTLKPTTVKNWMNKKVNQNIKNRQIIDDETYDNLEVGICT